MNTANRKLPTIIDISAATGLSKSVVSRALNGAPGVSRESRSAVAKAAEDLGYVANTMARRMRTKRLDTVGVLVRDPASPFHGTLLAAMQAAAPQLGIRLVTMTGSGSQDPEEERDALRALLALRVDGLLVCSAVLPASELYPFADRVPSVVVGRGEWDERISSVCCDDEDGARKLVDHVARAGWDQIVIPVPPRVSPTLHVRANLFIARAREKGISPLIVPSDSAADFVGKMPRIKGRFVIMAPNDRWAVPTLERIGRSADHLVTGYDGVGVYASPLLGLTTIVQPLAEIANAALQLLPDLLAGVRPPEHIRFPGRLQIP
jgi:DNA-binding LacI/PurR family transcriptional regulator